MIIIFGWQKETEEIANFTQCYCYNCSEIKRWVLHTETEWISFFAIKTIPFLIKRKIYCERCGDTLDIPNMKFSTMKKNPQLLSEYIENTQLSKKTEVQQKYLQERRKELDDNI